MKHKEPPEQTIPAGDMYHASLHKRYGLMQIWYFNKYTAPNRILIWQKPKLILCREDEG